MRLSQAPRCTWLLLAVFPLLLCGAGQQQLVRQVWVTLTPRASLQYMRFDSVPMGVHRVHVVLVDLADESLDVKPALAVETATPGELARRYGAIAAINGGYFNISDGLTVSYVTIDGRLSADPRRNGSLVGNLELRPYLARVFNRTELRILVDGRGRRVFAISSHEAPLSRGYRLVHALQGGPSLQPALRIYEEAFIRPSTGQVPGRVAISALAQAARSAIGLLSEQRAVFLLVERGPADAGPAGMTIPQLAEFMKGLGCSSAMALDGGSSSSLYFHTDPRQPPLIIPGRTGTSPAAVKSALLIFRRAEATGGR